MPPLAERLRPRSLDTYVGQEHLVGPGAVLRAAVERGELPSMILWGPPGVGKTTLAHVLATSLGRPFSELSAINAGVKDIRAAIERARERRLFDTPAPVLFIDEIHRFSKSQQDALLGAVERGVVTLVGATTENPSFEVIPALLSRAHVYVLEPLSREHLIGLVDAALERDETLRARGLSVRSYDALLRVSGGDARRLYNALELIAQQEEAARDGITDDLVARVVQNNLARYDKTGEQHYDIISAFIKSIRGSDPNAAVYYLARMLEGGEDIKFIGRRLIISAAEDVGLANPNALLLAQTCFESIQAVGMPEARIILSQCAVYLATSPKSNASYVAIDKAMAEVRKSGNLSVPLSLRNAPTKLMKQLDYGKNYLYSHDHPGNFAHQEFLPEEVSGQAFYEPGDNPAERKTRERLRHLWREKYGY